MTDKLLRFYVPWLFIAALVVLPGIFLTCVSDNPTEPAAGGTEDEEDRDEIIFTRADDAYMTSPNDSTTYVYTKSFIGNPREQRLSAPVYALVLYDEKNSIVRMGFGGLYDDYMRGVGYQEHTSIGADEYLWVGATLRFEDIEVRPLYYLNAFAWGYEQAEVEKIIRAHFGRMALKKLGKMISGAGCLLR